MFWYLIDGLNVIYHLKGKQAKLFPHETLLYFLRAYRLTGSSKNRVTIVFDGPFQQQIKENCRDFEIIFSMGESADDIIVRLIEKNSNNQYRIKVVTNDRELGYRCKMRHAEVIKVDDFLAKTKKETNLKKENLQDGKQIPWQTAKEITEQLKKKWLKE